MPSSGARERMDRCMLPSSLLAGSRLGLLRLTICMVQRWRLVGFSRTPQSSCRSTGVMWYVFSAWVLCGYRCADGGVVKSLTLAIILTVQLSLGAYSVYYANAVFCKDDSHLTNARLLRRIPPFPPATLIHVTPTPAVQGSKRLKKYIPENSIRRTPWLLWLFREQHRYRNDLPPRGPLRRPIRQRFWRETDTSYRSRRQPRSEG